MIRDPSDGSVKEARRPMVSGMREPDQAAADELERLNKSREWLKEYRKAVHDANRMNDKGEVTAE